MLRRAGAGNFDFGPSALRGPFRALQLWTAQLRQRAHNFPNCIWNKGVRTPARGNGISARQAQG